MSETNLSNGRKQWAYNRHKPAVVRRYGPNCHYCGILIAGPKLSLDHFIPLALGGSDCFDNLVPACVPCNVTKGSRPLDRARDTLKQKVAGWPKFNPDQLAWLRAKGFDMSEFDNAKLWFERQAARIVPIPVNP